MPDLISPRIVTKSRVRQWALAMLQLTVSSRRLLVRGDATPRSVHLTFDDGPDPDTTPRILDVLRRHQVRATFFVVGRQAAAHPDIVRRMAAEGHTVGGHTFSHRPPEQVSSRELIAEVQETEALLLKILGRRCRIFRPPFGKLTVAKLWRLWTEQRSIVLWNRDPKDFAASNAGQLAAWFRKSPLAAGDIVLLHDTSIPTVEVLEEIILRTRCSGLEFAPLA